MLNFITEFAVVQVVFLVIIALLILIPYVSMRIERSTMAERDYKDKQAEQDQQRWVERKRLEDIKSGRLIEHPGQEE